MQKQLKEDALRLDSENSKTFWIMASGYVLYDLNDSCLKQIDGLLFLNSILCW